MRAHLVFVTAIPATAKHFLKGQLTALREAGFRVSLVSSPGPDLWEVGRIEGVDTFPIRIAREIEPLADATALLQLTDLFQRIQPDIVQASTPKGGLIGMLAARLAGVPQRFYLLRGLRLETAEGGLRSLLGATERLTSAAAHQVICVSPSLRDAYVNAGYAPANKCSVIGSGSSNGVNAAAYDRGANLEAARALSKQIGLPQGAPVIGFAGRMVEDKGITPLLDAYETLKNEIEDLQLVMVGDSLAGDTVEPAIKARIEGLGAQVLPYIPGLGPFYAMIDVLAFPSYREGFPNVPLEASAAGLPVVGFASTGVVDAIQDGVTGTIVPRQGLAEGLRRYLEDADLRSKHGSAGRERACQDFAPERIWKGWIELYGASLAGT